MRNLANFFSGLRIRSLSPWMAIALVFAMVIGMAGQVDAQTSRYILDDVMDKMIEMDKRLSHVMDKVIDIDKRLSVVESQIKNLGDRIDDTNARIDNTNTTMRWLFGFLGSLFLGILVLTFATYRNTASLVKPTEQSVFKEAKVLEVFRKEVREIAEQEERALQEKLQAVSRSAPKEAKLLEALEQKVSALAERQKELEGKLKLAEVI